MGFGGHNVRKKYCLKCQDHTLEYLVERICGTLGYIYFPKMLKLMLLCGLFLAGVYGEMMKWWILCPCCVKTLT